jgi:hypothetical protein
MLSEVQIGNSLCAFHLICIILEVINNFPSILRNFTIGKPALFTANFFSNLPAPLVSIPHTIVPSWNCHIDNYMYGIFGFTNKYMERNGTILNFHDDDLHVFKEIKSLDTNCYEIHCKWVVINSLLWMNRRIKGKMIIPLIDCVYITYHSIESYYINSYCSLSCRFNWIGQLFLFAKWVDLGSKKLSKDGET